jgi:hypothetical protein
MCEKMKVYCSEVTRNGLSYNKILLSETWRFIPTEARTRHRTRSRTGSNLLALSHFISWESIPLLLSQLHFWLWSGYFTRRFIKKFYMHSLLYISVARPVLAFIILKIQRFLSVWLSWAGSCHSSFILRFLTSSNTVRCKLGYIPGRGSTCPLYVCSGFLHAQEMVCCSQTLWT